MSSQKGMLFGLSQLNLGVRLWHHGLCLERFSSCLLLDVGFLG